MAKFHSNAARWVSDLRTMKVNPNDMRVSDLIDLAQMVIDGDLRHVDEQDFRDEMAAEAAA